MWRTAAKDLTRLRQISSIVARHGYRQLAESIRRGRADVHDPALRAETAAVSHAPARLRQLLQDLGPTFIKLGQVLSTRADLIPTPYQRELAHLQDDVDPLEFEHIRTALETAWGAPVQTHLASIDETPLATASIAQVHRAVLQDGREVAIKVQRPGVAETIRADLDLLYMLGRLLDATVEEMGIYRPVEVVSAFERAIWDELDFEIEARNARAIAANFEAHPIISIPEVIDALSDRHVLVMEYVDGRKPTELDPEIHDIDAIVQVVLDVAFQMAFRDGLFHADPHPGNVRVTDAGQIYLLDFGLVGRLTGHMQEALIQLALAVATRDAENTARLIYRIGQPTDRIDLRRFRDEISDLMGRYLVRRLDEVDAASLVNELLDVAMRYGIRVQPDYALLGKAAITIEGVMRTLAPNLDIARTILPYAHKLIGDRYSPKAVGQLALRGALGLLDSAQNLPLWAHQMASDLEAGRLSVRVRNDELDRLGRSLNALGTKVFLGMLAMGLILGTFFVLPAYPIEWRGYNVWALFGATTAFLIALGVLTWHALYGRIRKIRLRFLLSLWRGRSGPTGRD